MSNSLEQAVLQELDQDGSLLNNWNLTGKNTFKLGRSPANDIVLPYSWVSRAHSMVRQEGQDIFQIMDLGSSNGTYVNNKKIHSPTIIHNGDIVTLGKTIIKFIQFTEDNNREANKDDFTLDMTVAYLKKEVMTILVCDIHDFTSLSEEIGNKRVSQLLQFWTKKVGTIINDHEGVVDKFIGDAVMATWIGGNVEKGIRNALRTALEINNATKKISESIQGLDTVLSVGAAINTGEAMMGNMGVAGHRDSTVIGDVVNVAFRLESMTEKDTFDIIIGQESARHIDNPEKYFSKHSFKVKGKAEKIGVYASAFDQLNYFLTATAGTAT
jgi:adenylate cyclase